MGGWIFEFLYWPLHVSVCTLKMFPKQNEFYSGSDPAVLSRGSCGGAGPQGRSHAAVLRHQHGLPRAQRHLAQDGKRRAAHRVAPRTFAAGHLLPPQQGLYRNVHRYFHFSAPALSHSFGNRWIALRAKTVPVPNHDKVQPQRILRDPRKANSRLYRKIPRKWMPVRYYNISCWTAGVIGLRRYYILVYVRYLLIYFYFLTVTIGQILIRTRSFGDSQWRLSFRLSFSDLFLFFV